MAKDAFPWLTNKGKRAMGVGNQNPQPRPAPAAPAPAAPKPVTALAPAPAAPAAPAQIKLDAPMTIDFGDINADIRQKGGSMRRTLLAGDTGGFNPATGNSMLGGRRTLLG